VAALQEIAPSSTAASCSLQPSSLLAPPHTVFRTMLTNRNEDLSDSQVSHEERHDVMEGTNRSATNHRLSRPAGEFEIGRDCNLVRQHSTYFTMYHRSLHWMLTTRGIVPPKPRPGKYTRLVVSSPRRRCVSPSQVRTSRAHAPYPAPCL
jgi:hypothetical protein